MFVPNQKVSVELNPRTEPLPIVVPATVVQASVKTVLVRLPDGHIIKRHVVKHNVKPWEAGLSKVAEPVTEVCQSETAGCEVIENITPSPLS